MKKNKKTKPVQSAGKKLFDSDAYTDILDAALTSAEEELKALLPTLKPSEVSEAFATHIHRIFPRSCPTSRRTATETTIPRTFHQQIRIWTIGESKKGAT